MKCNVVDISCPEDFKIAELRNMGIEVKSDNNEIESVCPLSFSSTKHIKLNLMDKCSFSTNIKKTDFSP